MDHSYISFTDPAPKNQVPALQLSTLDDIESALAFATSYPGGHGRPNIHLTVSNVFSFNAIASKVYSVVCSLKKPLNGMQKQQCGTIIQKLKLLEEESDQNVSLLTKIFCCFCRCHSYNAHKLFSLDLSEPEPAEEQSEDIDMERQI